MDEKQHMKQHIIPHSDMRFPFPLKRLDKNGQVFFYKNDVYRGIYPHCAEFIQTALHSPIVQQLMQDQKLVKTTICSKQFEGFPVTLQHERMPLASKPKAWSILTYLTAARTYLDIYQKLYNNGFALMDGHPLNFSLADKGYVIWHDFSSIVPRNDIHLNGLHGYLNHFYHPLMIYKYLGDFDFIRSINFQCAKHNYYLIRRPMFLPNIVKIQQLNKKRERKISYKLYNYATNSYFIKASIKEKLRHIYAKTRGRQKVFNDVNRYIDRLRKDISDIHLHQCTRHIHNENNQFDAQTINQKTINKVVECINRLSPKSILDLGGHLSHNLGVKHLKANKIIAILHNEKSASQCTQKLMASNNKIQIFPLLIKKQHIVEGDILEYKTDIAISLYLADYMRIFYLNTFEHIIYFFQQITNKYFIARFNDNYTTLFKQHYDDSNGLTLRRFIDYLEKYFTNVQVLDNNSTDKEVIFLCEK